MPEKLYTTGEVAKLFGFSYVAVKKWVYSGKIKYITLLIHFVLVGFCFAFI
jgi:predicted site-specific integrase-resolvase